MPCLHQAAGQTSPFLLSSPGLTSLHPGARRCPPIRHDVDEQMEGGDASGELHLLLCGYINATVAPTLESCGGQAQIHRLLPPVSFGEIDQGSIDECSVKVLLQVASLVPWPASQSKPTFGASI